MLPPSIVPLSASLPLPRLLPASLALLPNTPHRTPCYPPHCFCYRSPSWLKLPTSCYHASIGKGFLLESVTQGILSEAPHRDSIGMPHNRIPLESTTEGFYWKASQQEPFGKHHNGFLLESFTQQHSFGNHHQGIPLESLTTGFLWKARRRASAGQPHKGIPLESTTK